MNNHLTQKIIPLYYFLIPLFIQLLIILSVPSKSFYTYKTGTNVIVQILKFYINDNINPTTIADELTTNSDQTTIYYHTVYLMQHESTPKDAYLIAGKNKDL